MPRHGSGPCGRPEANHAPRQDFPGPIASGAKRRGIRCASPLHKDWRRVTKLSVEQQKAYFCETPPAEEPEPGKALSAGHTGLTNEERPKLMGILFDIRPRAFDFSGYTRSRRPIM